MRNTIPDFSAIKLRPFKKSLPDIIYDSETIIPLPVSFSPSYFPLSYLLRIILRGTVGGQGSFSKWRRVKYMLSSTDLDFRQKLVLDPPIFDIFDLILFELLLTEININFFIIFLVVVCLTWQIKWLSMNDEACGAS